MRRRRHCSYCEEPGHYRPTCPKKARQLTVEQALAAQPAREENQNHDPHPDLQQVP